MKTRGANEALTVTCPNCGAGPDYRCFDHAAGKSCGIHAERYLVIDSYTRLRQTSFAAELLGDQDNSAPGLGL